MKSKLSILFKFPIVIFILLMTIENSLCAQSLTVDDLKKRAIWEATQLDITIDLTKKQPTYNGTMILKTDANSSKGPVLMLNNREASMKMTNIEASNALGEKAQLSEQAHPDTERVGTLYVIDFKSFSEGVAEVTVTFEYEFIAEQGQVLQREHLSYASWVTLWYPVAIADSGSFVSKENLSIPGPTSFILPKDWHALSNGKLVVDQQDQSGNKQTWRVGPGIARSYVAAPFQVSNVRQGNIDIKMYLLDASPHDAENKAHQFARIIDVLENAFGVYPYATFALAEIPDGTTDYFGASSEQGFIVAESKNFEGDDGLALFAHEAGHSWWGNLFSCEGSGASLCSEALAQLGAVLAVEALDGKEALKDFLDVSVPTYSTYQSARGYFAMVRSNVDEPLSEIESDSWKVHRLMDSKGMWFWQMLRLELGDDLFFEVLRNLTQQAEGMTLEDLQTYFGEESGIDLNVFFDQWLKRKGAPIISIAWESPMDLKTYEYLGDMPVESILLGDPETEFKVTISLTQEQEDLYHLRIPIEFQFYSGDSEVREVELSTSAQTFELTFGSNIRDIILDPEHTILMWRPAYGPKPKQNEM